MCNVYKKKYHIISGVCNKIDQKLRCYVYVEKKNKEKTIETKWRRSESMARGE